MSNPDPPVLAVTGDVATLTFSTDGYALDFQQVSCSKYGNLYAHVTARHGETVLHTARFDLLNQREQELFHQRCGAVNSSVADWQSRLQSAIPGLRTLTAGQGTQGGHDAGAVWRQALTAQAFLLQEEMDVLAHVKDLVVPGCITLVAAPRASGKSLVALYLGVALASGGVFRQEQLTPRRVLLVDRDNPPSLVRKRLRWLGAHQVTALKVLTREAAPPLTDKVAWEAFPVEDYDVVLMDSLGAATEGVSEKEGRQTQEFLATLKDLARRGPALLCLDNTIKAGTNYRGRGEKADAVDILYECRNITGWTPSEAGDWWEHLPDFGEHTWQQRTTRRKGQAVMRVAFIPTKFRLGIEPEPFILEIDTHNDPWTLADVTENVATAGAQAAQETSRQARATAEHAEHMLVQALAARPADTPMMKSEAETRLRGYGLQQRVARTLLERGGNRDIYPTGRWVIRPIPNHPTGKALGVYLVNDEEDDKRSNVIPFPSKHGPNSAPPFVNGSAHDDERSTLFSASDHAAVKEVDLSSQPSHSMTKGDTPPTQQSSALLQEGGPFVTSPSSSAPRDDRAAEPTNDVPTPVPQEGCLQGGAHTWIRRATDRLCGRCNATSLLPADDRSAP